jgi:hypothetical protein
MTKNGQVKFRAKFGWKQRHAAGKRTPSLRSSSTAALRNHSLLHSVLVFPQHYTDSSSPLAITADTRRGRTRKGRIIDPSKWIKFRRLVVRMKIWSWHVVSYLSTTLLHLRCSRNPGTLTIGGRGPVISRAAKRRNVYVTEIVYPQRIDETVTRRLNNGPRISVTLYRSDELG